MCYREGHNLLLQEPAGKPWGAGGMKPRPKGRDGTSKGGRHSRCQEGLPGRSSGCPRSCRGRCDEGEWDREGGLHSPVGLWARAWAGRLVKQEARSPSARGLPSCRPASFGRNHGLISLVAGRKPLLSWGRGRGVWREEGAAHPALEVLPEIPPNFLLTPLPSPGRILHHLPLPLPG